MQIDTGYCFKVYSVPNVHFHSSYTNDRIENVFINSAVVSQLKTWSGKEPYEEEFLFEINM